MTRNEAEERAKRIWPNSTFVLVKIQNRRTAWPTGNPEHDWFVDEQKAETPQGRAIRVHILDTNGHTCCHPECAKKESALR